MGGQIAIGRMVVVASLFWCGVLRVGAGADEKPIDVDLKTFKFKVAEAQADLVGYDDGQSRLFYYIGGTGEAVVKLPADGDYEIVIKASCDPAQNERAKFKVTLDGEAVGEETLLTADDEKEYVLKAKGKAGERKLAIQFTNDVYKAGEFDRNFYVHGVTVRKGK